MDNIYKKLSKDELRKVNEFSKRFYNSIIGKHPEWDKYAKVENWGWLSFVMIEIPPPLQDVFPILIAASEEDDEEISVYF